MTRENCFPFPSPKLLLPNQEPDVRSDYWLQSSPNLPPILDLVLKDQADLAALTLAVAWVGLPPNPNTIPVKQHRFLDSVIHTGAYRQKTREVQVLCT